MTCTYSIWRVQNNNNSMKYTKINNTVKKQFKSDNHNTFDSAQKEADKYIKYIQNNSNRNISYDFDQIYIIDSNQHTQTAHIFQAPYYNLWDLFTSDNTEVLYLEPKPRSNDIFTYILLYLQFFCCCHWCHH